MEMYVVIAKSIEFYLGQITTTICEAAMPSISKNISKIMKKLELLISDLGFLVKFITDGEFLTKNSRYKMET